MLSLPTRLVPLIITFHPGNQISKRRFHAETKMVSHQAPGVHFPPALIKSLPQTPREKLPVLISADNVLPPIAAIHHVVDRSFEFDSGLSRQGPNVSLSLRVVSLVSVRTRAGCRLESNLQSAVALRYRTRVSRM
jgi:hypothetical protein